MNRKDLVKVLYVAEYTDFGDQFSTLAGDLANSVHQAKFWGDVVTDTMHVAALFKWQARCLNGSWDQKGLDDCFEWLKRMVVITDLDEKYAEVKAVVQGKQARGHEPVFNLKVEPSDSRFKLIEL